MVETVVEWVRKGSHPDIYRIKRDAYDATVTFRSRLRRLRKRAGLSQDALASLCGWSRSVISRYERGSSSPGIRDLVVLCGVLDVTPDDLLLP